MKVWEIKTMRHGVTLVQAPNIRHALMEFDAFHRDYLKSTGTKPDKSRDEISSCVCLGGVVNA